MEATYPNIETDAQNINYNELLDKLRTALLGNAAPWFGDCRSWAAWNLPPKVTCRVEARDVGYATSDFWPGAVKSVTWEGKTYASPLTTKPWPSSECQDLQGCRPRSRKPPATWDEVVAYSKTIHTSSARRYGLLPSRTPATRRSASCPSSGPMRRALDEAPRSPSYDTVELNSAESRLRCRRLTTCMCATNRCPSRPSPTAANETKVPSLAGQLR